MVFTLSDDVQTPGVYELPMGTRLRELVVGLGGGPKWGRTLKALFSGVSNPVVLPSSLATPLDFGSMQKIGSGLGSGGFIAYDDTTCMVRVAHHFSEFLDGLVCLLPRSARRRPIVSVSSQLSR